MRNYLFISSLQSNLMKTLFFFSIVFTTTFSYSQTSYSLIEANILGSSANDQMEKIKHGDNGDIYVLARTSATSNDGDANIDFFGNSDAWLLKLDMNKNILWQKSYGGSDFETAKDIQLLSNGNVLLFINSSSQPSGNRTAHRKGASDIWIVEVNSINGDIINQVSIGGDGNDIYADSKVRSNGEVVLLCHSNDSGAGAFSITDPPYLDSTSNDPWIAILDNQLSIIQQKRLTQGYSGGGASLLWGSSLIISDNFLYIASTTNGEAGGDKSDPSFDTSSTPYLSDDCWLIKLDWSFNVIWDKTFGGEDSEKVVGISITDDKNLIVVMDTRSGVSGNKNSDLTGTGNQSLWLIKVDENGNKIVDKTYGNSGFSWGWTQLLKLTNDRYIFGGYTEPINDVDFSNVTFFGGGNDGFLMTVDRNLDMVDNSAFGTSGEDRIHTLSLNNGNITTGGLSVFNGTNIYHPTNSNGGSDLWLLEFSTTLSVDGFDHKKVVIYPNPAIQTVNILGEELKNVKLYDLNGRLVLGAELQKTNKNSIEVSQLNSGTYFVKISDGKNETIQKLIIK